MTDAEKIRRMHQHLPQIGIRRSVFAPPIYRLLWFLAIPARPPLFAPFWVTVLTMGGFFGLAMGALSLVFYPHLPLELHLVLHAAGGLFFGLFIALYNWWVAKRHELPSWEAYAPSDLALSPGAPSAASSPDLIACHWCAEPIRRAAKACRYCNRDVPGTDNP